MVLRLIGDGRGRGVCVWRAVGVRQLEVEVSLGSSRRLTRLCVSSSLVLQGGGNNSLEPDRLPDSSRETPSG